MSINAVFMVYGLTAIGAVLATRYHRKTPYRYIGVMGFLLVFAVFIVLVMVRLGMLVL